MKKGFTMVEMLVSFVVASIVMILLFNLTMLLKSLYVNYGVKTEILIKEANLLRSMEDVLGDGVTNVTSCGENCLDITSNGKVYNLKLQGQYGTTILFNKQVTKFNTYSTEIKSIKSEQTSAQAKYSSNPNIHNSVLTITIEIYDKVLAENYDIVYNITYNDAYGELGQNSEEQ